MYRTYFDRRRSLHPTMGLPKQLLSTEVRSSQFAELLQTPYAKERLKSDPTPIPAPEDREGYYENFHLDYWASGFDDFLKMESLFAGLPKPIRYLDLGGATGRVVRHSRMRPDVESWLADINVNWIDWVLQHMPADVRAFQCRINPSLPIEDNFFSIISAFSVFTHLDNDELPWLLELNRVLKPGGLLYITTVDENVWSKLKEPEWAWYKESISRGVRSSEFDQLIQCEMPSERFVWEYSDVDSYNVNLFHKRSYVERVWARFLDLVSYTPAHHGPQTVVVLRKPN